MSDKPIGKITNIEMEIALDNMKELLPSMIEQTKQTAKLHYARYNALVYEGFTEKQAMQIVVGRPLYE
ncbi:hypothetical protein PMSD_28115 [Paenibacillus macquariensis subsp. defensor]|nr:hypothetical protein PMSD_28115 [Paenibacillus macquariensis subsp. defensor]